MALSLFGIDKSSLGNVIINSIDDDYLRTLQSQGADITINETINGGFELPLTNGSTKQYTLIKIIDNFLFIDFTIGVINNKDFKVYYTTLNLSSSIADNVANLKPLLYGEYKSKLKVLEDYFLSMYHIDLSLEDTYFKEIEINKTLIDTKYSFEDYNTLFDTLQAYMNPKQYKVKDKYGLVTSDTNNYFSTFEFATSKRKKTKKSAKRLKIYDKRLELSKRQIGIDTYAIRFEYVLREEQITKNLGTNKVHNLNDTILLDFYESNITKDVFETLDKAIKDQNKQLVQMYQDVKSNMKRGYLREFFHRASHIAIDQEQVEAIALADMKKSGNYKKNKALLESIVPQHNLDKLEELKELLLLS